MRVFAFVVVVLTICFSSRAEAAVGYWSRYSGPDPGCTEQEFLGFDAYLQCTKAPYGCTIDDGPLEKYVHGSGVRWVQGYNSYTDAACTLGEDFQVVHALFSDPPACQDGEIFDLLTGVCIADPDACDAGLAGVMQVRTNTSGDQPAQVCYSNCVANRGGGMAAGSPVKWSSYTYEITDQQCAGGEVEELYKPSDEEAVNCVTSGGQQHCYSPEEPNCGYVNGNRYCADDVENEGCYQFGNADMVCGVLADSPPAPDDGVTPGTPAVPDEVIESADGTVINYYSGSTVNSSVGPTQGVSPEGVPGGDGAGEGEGEGEGECEGGECEGELPGENEEVETFGNLTKSFMDRVEAAPVVAAIGALGSGLPVGTCEAKQSDAIEALGGMVLEIEAHCTIWDSISHIVTGVMLAAWTLLGGLIILRA